MGTAAAAYDKRARLQPVLGALLDDPLLLDAPRNAAVADIDTLISVELGSAMKLSISKMDHTSFDVAVLNTAPVRDLKIAVQKKVNGMEQAKMGHRHISWRHVWKNFCLCYMNQKLMDDTAILQYFGIRNNSQLCFIPCVSSREAGKRSHARKRRFFHGLGKQS